MVNARCVVRGVDDNFPLTATNRFDTDLGLVLFNRRIYVETSDAGLGFQRLQSNGRWAGYGRSHRPDTLSVILASRVNGGVEDTLLLIMTFTNVTKAETFMRDYLVNVGAQAATQFAYYNTEAGNRLRTSRSSDDASPPIVRLAPVRNGRFCYVAFRTTGGLEFDDYDANVATSHEVAWGVEREPTKEGHFFNYGHFPNRGGLGRLRRLPQARIS